MQIIRLDASKKEKMCRKREKRNEEEDFQSFEVSLGQHVSMLLDILLAGIIEKSSLL